MDGLMFAAFRICQYKVPSEMKAMTNRAMRNTSMPTGAFTTKSAV